MLSLLSHALQGPEHLIYLKVSESKCNYFKKSVTVVSIAHYLILKLESTLSVYSG